MKMKYEDMLPFCKSERQKEVIKVVISEGSQKKAAKKLGVNSRSLERVLETIRKNSEKAKMKENFDIIVIADTQVTPDSPLSHLYSLSKYIWQHKPSHIVHIGDHWDFQSLSSYASRLKSEGKRLADDLHAGYEAFELIMAHTKKMSKRTGIKYNPKKHFLMGNHENRLYRYMNENPLLHGCFDLEDFVRDQGWSYHKMNNPVWIHGVCFSHYMENPQSGRAVGGSIENKLNKFPHSFVHGHQQQFQYGRRQNLKGQPHFGVCAGSFYIHDEEYRGANNTEIRGFVHLKGFENRYGYIDHDVEFISLERLLSDYEDNLAA